MIQTGIDQIKRPGLVETDKNKSRLRQDRSRQVEHLSRQTILTNTEPHFEWCTVKYFRDYVES